jgi:hypothetical protein
VNNTPTLSSDLFTPIGLILSLSGSLINHSCDPNSAVVYNGRTISVRVLESLNTGTELTVSYIHTNKPVSARRSELENMFHFTCNCSQCSHNLTLNQPDQHPDLGPLAGASERIALESRVNELITKVKGASSMAEQLVYVAKAFQLFKPYPKYPAYLSPLQDLRPNLTYTLQGNKLWIASFIQSMILLLEAEPVIYHQEAHPARVARLWVYSKLAAHIGSLAQEPGQADLLGAPAERDAAIDLGIKFNLDWGLVVWTFVSSASNKVLKSHGIESRLSRDIGRAMQGLREEAKANGREPDQAVIEKTWHALQDVARHGWDWWKTWESERRTKAKLIVSAQGAEDGVSILLDS